MRIPLWGSRNNWEVVIMNKLIAILKLIECEAKQVGWVVNGLLGGKDIPKDVEVARGDIKAYLQLATILGRSDDMVSYEVNDWFLMHDTLVRDNAIIFLNNCDDLKEAMYLCGYTSERTEPKPNLEFSSIPRI